MPTCWIIAGPNGAGKTTFALEFLPTLSNGLAFINADLIAAGLSPLDPAAELAAASRIFIKEIKQAFAKGKDFAFETTLAGRSYLKRIRDLKANGWRVELIYLALPSLELSKQRVAERVQHGGHDIPIADLERRFPRSLANLLETFSSEATQTRCFINSGNEPGIVFEQSGSQRIVYDESMMKLLENLSRK